MIKDEQSEQPDFEAMTKATLLAYAEEHGIEGVSSSMTKAQIIEIILSA